MRNTPLTTLTGRLAPLMRANIDTDAIFPSRSKMGVDETDVSRFLFREWRLTDDGQERPEFVLNQPSRRNAVFLIALDNFGCGSSRETAPWALRDFGIRCIVAPSFGSIFQANCYRNGIAPVVLDRKYVETLGSIAENDDAMTMTLDLATQVLATSGGWRVSFAMPSGAKAMLMEGLDTIGVTLTRRTEIETFQRNDVSGRPWVYVESLNG